MEISSRKIIELVLNIFGLLVFFSVFFGLLPSLFMSLGESPNKAIFKLLVLTAVQLVLGGILIVRSGPLASLIVGEKQELELPDSISYPEILRLLIIVLGLGLCVYNLMYLGGVIFEQIVRGTNIDFHRGIFLGRVVKIAGGIVLILTARRIASVVYSSPESWVTGIDSLGEEHFIALVCVVGALLIFLLMLF